MFASTNHPSPSQPILESGQIPPPVVLPEQEWLVKVYGGPIPRIPNKLDRRVLEHRPALDQLLDWAKGQFINWVI